MVHGLVALLLLLRESGYARLFDSLLHDQRLALLIISLLLGNRPYDSGLTYIQAIKFGVEHQCVKQVPPRHVEINKLFRSICKLFTG